MCKEANLGKLLIVEYVSKANKENDSDEEESNKGP